MKIVKLDPDRTRDSQHHGSSLKQYCFALDGYGDQNWGRIFEEVRAGLFSMQKRNAYFEGDCIFVDCTEGELPAQLEQLKRDVKATDDIYEARKKENDDRIAQLQEEYRVEQERLKDLAGKLNFD